MLGLKQCSGSDARAGRVPYRVAVVTARLRQEDGKRRHESGMDRGFGKAFDTIAGRPAKRQAR